LHGRCSVCNARAWDAGECGRNSQDQAQVQSTATHPATQPPSHPPTVPNPPTPRTPQPPEPTTTNGQDQDQAQKTHPSIALTMVALAPPAVPLTLSLPRSGWGIVCLFVCLWTVHAPLQPHGLDGHSFTSFGMDLQPYPVPTCANGGDQSDDGKREERGGEGVRG